MSHKDKSEIEQIIENQIDKLSMLNLITLNSSITCYSSVKSTNWFKFR